MSASMNDVKARIKSVQSTMQITKAMELVATSKLRRAKERAEKTRPFYEVLENAITALSEIPEARESVWTKSAEGKTLFVMIAGDRGLAGGYNANIFRMTEQLAKGKDALYLPVGKRRWNTADTEDIRSIPRRANTSQRSALAIRWLWQRRSAKASASATSQGSFSFTQNSFP